MKKQEIFDTVVNHLRSMPQKSYSKEISMCAYRGDIVNNVQLKCALGILIPDEKYEKSMEGLPACSVIEEYKLKFLSRSKTLLEALQELHDEPNNWNEKGFIGETSLEFIAKKYNLKYKPPL